MNDISNIQKITLDPFSTFKSYNINRINNKFALDGNCLLYGLDILPQVDKILIKKGSFLKDSVFIEFTEDILLPFSETNYVNQTTNIVAIKYKYEVKNKYNYAIVDIVSIDEYQNNKNLYLYLTHIEIENNVFKNFLIDFNELKIMKNDNINKNIIDFFINNITSNNLTIENDINNKIKFHVLNDQHIHNNQTIESINFNKIINIPQINLTLSGDLNGTENITDFNNIVINTELSQTSHTHNSNEINSVDWFKISNKPSINIIFNGDAVNNGYYSDTNNLNIIIGLKISDDSHTHSDQTIKSIDWEKILNKPDRLLFKINKPTFIKPTNYLTNFWDIFEINPISANNAQNVPDYDGIQDYVYWQLSDTSNFSNIIAEYEGSENLTQIDFKNFFVVNKTYYVRVKQGCNNYFSEWSDTVQFTTKSTVNITAPTILQPSNNAINLSTKNITISLSDYQSDIDKYTHVSTDYQIASDYYFNNIVAESLNNTNNLKIINLSVNLLKNTSYYIRARFNSLDNFSSNWSSTVKFTTIVKSDKIFYFTATGYPYEIYFNDSFIKKDINYFVYLSAALPYEINGYTSCYIKLNDNFEILDYKFLIYISDANNYFRDIINGFIKSIDTNHFCYFKTEPIYNNIRNRFEYKVFIEQLNNNFTNIPKFEIINSNNNYNKFNVRMKKFNLSNNYVIFFKIIGVGVNDNEHMNENCINVIFIVDSNFNILKSKCFKKLDDPKKINIQNIDIDKNDNIVLYGYCNYYFTNSSGEYNERYVVRFDKNLNILDSLSGMVNFSMNVIYDSALTNDGNYFIFVGMYQNTKSYILKITKDLNNSVNGTYSVDVNIKEGNNNMRNYFKKVIIYNNTIICLGVTDEYLTSNYYFLISFDMELNCLNKKLIKIKDENVEFNIYNIEILDNKLVCSFKMTYNNETDKNNFGFIVMDPNLTYFNGELSDIPLEFLNTDDNSNNIQISFQKNSVPYTSLYKIVDLDYNFNYNNYLINTSMVDETNYYYNYSFDHTKDRICNFTRHEISLE